MFTCTLCEYLDKEFPNQHSDPKHTEGNQEDVCGSIVDLDWPSQCKMIKRETNFGN